RNKDINIPLINPTILLWQQLRPIFYTRVLFRFEADFLYFLPWFQHRIIVLLLFLCYPHFSVPPSPYLHATTILKVLHSYIELSNYFLKALPTPLIQQLWLLPKASYS